MKRDLFDKEQVLAAIKGSMGIISKIAHNLDGCAWGTANKYVNRWAETRAVYASLRNAGLCIGF